MSACNLALRNQRRERLLNLGVFKKTKPSNGYDFYFRKNLITTFDAYIEPDGNIAWTKSHLGGFLYHFLTLEQVLEQAPKELQNTIIFNLDLFIERG